MYSNYFTEPGCRRCRSITCLTIIDLAILDSRAFEPGRLQAPYTYMLYPCKSMSTRGSHGTQKGALGSFSHCLLLFADPLLYSKGYPVSVDRTRLIFGGVRHSFQICPVHGHEMRLWLWCCEMACDAGTESAVQGLSLRNLKSNAEISDGCSPGSLNHV